jgi:hypothetical protein
MGSVGRRLEWKLLNSHRLQDTAATPQKKKKEEEAVHEIGQIWSGIMRPFDKSGRELSKTPILENVPF